MPPYSTSQRYLSWRSRLMKRFYPYSIKIAQVQSNSGVCKKIAWLYRGPSSQVQAPSQKARRTALDVSIFLRLIKVAGGLNKRELSTGGSKQSVWVSIPQYCTSKSLKGPLVQWLDTYVSCISVESACCWTHGQTQMSSTLYIDSYYIPAMPTIDCNQTRSSRYSCIEENGCSAIVENRADSTATSYLLPGSSLPIGTVPYLPSVVKQTRLILNELLVPLKSPHFS